MEDAGDAVDSAAALLTANFVSVSHTAFLSSTHLVQLRSLEMKRQKTVVFLICDNNKWCCISPGCVRLK